jgi:hypothetical protein
VLGLWASGGPCNFCKGFAKDLFVTFLHDSYAASREGRAMRFSIVYDDNGTILSASEGGDVTDRPAPGPGENVGAFDIPDDLSGARLQEAVKRVLVEMDATKLAQPTAQKEG